MVKAIEYSPGYALLTKKFIQEFFLQNTLLSGTVLDQPCCPRNEFKVLIPFIKSMNVWVQNTSSFEFFKPILK